MLFRIGRSFYGLDTTLIQEVVRVGNLTAVPGAPADIVGIRNLRGKIITVIDMATHLGVEADQRNPDNRLILIDHHGDSYGFLVDSVSEAVLIPEEDIAPPTGNLDADFAQRLRGLWRNGNEMVSILDNQEIFCWPEAHEN